MHALRILQVFVALVFLLNAPMCGNGRAQDASAEDLIRSKVQQLSLEGEIRVQGVTLGATALLFQFYHNRDFKPAWGNPQANEELVRVIRASEGDGLCPSDYRLTVIEAMSRKRREDMQPELMADMDLLMTDAVLKLSHDMLYGKVDPKSVYPDWQMNHEGDDLDLPQAVQQAIENVQLDALIESLRPKHPLYGRLRRALAEYRKIAAAGGWRPIPAVPDIKKGDKDPRLPALRAHLASTGDLAAPLASNLSPVYGQKTFEAVRRFQDRHGLKPDGVIRSEVIEEMNVPVEKRIDQIRVNLERCRWVLREETGDVNVTVNIAGFELYYSNASGVHWEARVQVGKPYWKTPIFESRINRIVFNPTWTAPPTIVESEILPALRKNPAYLQIHKFRVLDAHGRPVSPGRIRWSNYNADNFPYRFIQMPGPKNALGRVKFMFPNKFDVYLHDTPNRRLFDANERTFSHGCIRVENAFHLVDLILDDPKWDKKRVNRVLHSKKTVTVHLKKAVPIQILYLTVEAFHDEDVRFPPDIYELDAAVLAGLSGDSPHT